MSVAKNTKGTEQGGWKNLTAVPLINERTSGFQKPKQKPPKAKSSIPRKSL